MSSSPYRRRGALALILLALAACGGSRPQPPEVRALLDDWQRLDATAVDARIRAAGSDLSTTPLFALDDGIALDEAEIVALVLNPALRLTRAQAGVAAAALPGAGRWDDPGVDLRVERILADVDEPWIVGAGIGFTIPLSGRPGAKARLAAAEVQAAEAAVLGAEWALRMEVRRAWYRLARERQHLDLLDAAIEDLTSLRSGVAILARAGLADALDLGALDLEILSRKDERLIAAGETHEAFHACLALLGLHEDQPWRLITDILGDPPAVDGEAVIADHPVLRQALAGHTIAAQRLDLARRGRIPDLSLSLGGGVENGDPRLGFGLGLIPLPVWNRSAGDIAGSEAGLAVAEAAITVALVDLVHRRRHALEEERQAQRRLDLIDREIAPLADRQRETARTLLADGQGDPLRFVDAVLAAHRVRLDRLDARAGLWQARIDRRAWNGPFSDPAGDQP